MSDGETSPQPEQKMFVEELSVVYKFESGATDEMTRRLEAAYTHVQRMNYLLVNTFPFSYVSRPEGSEALQNRMTDLSVVKQNRNDLLYLLHYVVDVMHYCTSIQTGTYHSRHTNEHLTSDELLQRADKKLEKLLSHLSISSSTENAISPVSPIPLDVQKAHSYVARLATKYHQFIAFLNATNLYFEVLTNVKEITDRQRLKIQQHANLMKAFFEQNERYLSQEAVETYAFFNVFEIKELWTNKIQAMQRPEVKIEHTFSMDQSISAHKVSSIVPIDGDILSDIIIGAISNAIKYRQTGTDVVSLDFQIRYENRKYIITITDDGVGTDGKTINFKDEESRPVHSNQREGSGVDLINLQTALEQYKAELILRPREDNLTGSTLFLVIPESVVQSGTLAERQ